MRMKFLKPVLVLVLLSLVYGIPAIASAPKFTKNDIERLQPLLNSERIKYFFGNYGVEQLSISSKDFSSSRISNLYSQDDHGKKIMRTLAIVQRVDAISPLLANEHRKIQAGGSIGTVMKEAGWKVIKTPIFFGSTHLSKNLLAWMRVSDAKRGEVFIYDLLVTKAPMPKPLPYCTIIEIYSPDYLNSRWIKALSKESHPTTSTASIRKLMASVRDFVRDFPSP